jgi:hypothetical protein
MSTSTTATATRRDDRRPRNIKQMVADAFRDTFIEYKQDLIADPIPTIDDFVAGVAARLGEEVFGPLADMFGKIQGGVDLGDVAAAAGDRRRQRGSDRSRGNAGGRRAEMDREHENRADHDKGGKEEKKKKKCCLCPSRRKPRRPGDRRDSRNIVNRPIGITPQRLPPAEPTVPRGERARAPCSKTSPPYEVYAATVGLDELRDGRRTTSAPPTSILPKCKGDQTCHIIGDSIGGANSQQNMFPCTRAMNNAMYNRSESVVERCLRNGATADIVVSMFYPTDPLKRERCCHRPEKVIYSVAFTGGRSRSECQDKTLVRTYRNHEPDCT